MCADQFRQRWLRITWRHLLILSVHLVILIKGVIPFLEGTVLKETQSVWLVSLLVSFPLLALLVMVIDRPGPVKNWAVWFLLCLVYPALALNHDAVVVGEYLVSGKHPSLWATLLLNATLLPTSMVYFGKMVPKPCPGCEKRSLIPLMRMFMKDKRTSNTRWCASCGGKYWKDQEGNWRVERRATWLDGPKEPSNPAANDPPPASRPESRRLAPRSLSRQEMNEVPPS